MIIIKFQTPIPYPKIFEISSINLLPLRWGRMKVGVDKGI
jgi:hypothetical protein